MPLASQEHKPSTAEEMNEKLDSIIKRLDTLESAILEEPEYAELAAFLRLMKAGIGLYADPLKIVADSQPKKRALKRRSQPCINAKLILKAKEVRVAEEVNLELNVTNEGEAPMLLVKVERITPQGFDLVSKPHYCRFQDTHLDLNRKKLEPLMTETIKITLRSFDKGSHLINPKIIFLDEAGHQMSFEPKPLEINITEIILPSRISTGYKDLDSLLFGGIPENFAVILTSPPSDERDLLIERFLRAGAKEHQITFYVTVDPSNAKSLAEESQSDLHLFVCNPQAETIVETLPHVHKLKGVDNLTNISIALNKALRKLDSPIGHRRACLEIISDVLLQHKAVQTRKWLSDLIIELKSEGFTTLAVIDPQMHSPQDVHAILGLFDGELNIYEKKLEEYSERFLIVKRMHGQKYLESMLTLRKDKLQI